MNDLLRRAGKFFYLPVLCTAFLLISARTAAPAAPRIATTPAPPAASLLPIPSPKGTPASFSLDDSTRLNSFYDNLDLEQLGLSAAAWHTAITGFLNLVLTGQVHNPSTLSIIDFSLPSTQKRLFILDMLNGTLIFNSLVAHGRNSGLLTADHFSNKFNSRMSSLGFYLTGDPFIGQHGYSLRLDGIEPGLNDNVYRRAIIMHPAPYVSEAHIRRWGFLGRSEGCPAIPKELNRPIIDSIRGGSCIFVYAANYHHS